MPDRSRDVTTRVLVVDADPTDLDALVGALEGAGHATTTATTAADGLSRLDEEHADAVVSDRALPDGEGVELLRRVRERHGDLPFVLVVDEADAELASEAIADDVSDLLGRPPDGSVPTDLVERVEAAVDDHRETRELRRIRERYELVAMASADAIWDWDLDTDEVARSQGFETAFGYDADEVEEVFDWWAERIHPDDRRRVHEELDRALREEARYRDAYRFRMGDGSYGHVESSGVIVHGDGDPVRMVGTLADATEIVEERERFQAILEQSADLVTVLDEDGRTTYVSPAVEAILGYDPATLVGERLFEYVHPDDRKTVVGAFRGLVEETTTDRYLRFRARHADGSWRWLEPLATGRVPAALDGYVITMRDVTARVENEQRLARSETILQTVPDGIYTTDDAGRFATLNDALAELLGGEVSSLLGERVHDFVAPEDREESARLEEQLHAGELDIAEVEFDVIGLDGTRSRVENRFTRLPGDEAGGTAGVVRDITERTAREAAIRRHNERLEEFSAVLSHDLRNPLNVAMGSLELAAEDRQDDRNFVRARRALDRMDELIDRLRALARADQDITEPEPVPLDAVVGEAWAMAGVDAAELRTEDELGTAVCDRERTRALLENLFANAVGHAGPDVIVRIGRLDDGFFVADDGPGIPQTDRDRVFAPGYSTDGNGTGLGLEIVRTVARAHGWRIAVGDAEDGGARFEFTGVEFGSRLAGEYDGAS